MQCNPLPSAPGMPDALGVYIHVPFCARKCAYCDFHSLAGRDHLTGPVVEATLRHIERSGSAGRRVGSAFIGGGTPTMLGAADLARLLGAVRRTFDVAGDAEVTSEANPNTADATRFAALREAGCNRLSIGVQALDDNLLRALGRMHTAADGASAVRAARSAGFDNVNVDLMFGLPGQSTGQWAQTLEAAAALEPEHVSAYALTLEPGTPMRAQFDAGDLALPVEDDVAEMLEHCIAFLGSAGYERYEVSNFARPGSQCRHNLVYWRNEEYAGFGPGAVSFVSGRRWTNTRDLEAYAEAVAAGRPCVEDEERPGPRQALAETLMMGLRLRDGIALDRLRARHGDDVLEHLAEPIARLSARGLLALDTGSLALTARGMLFADDVLAELVP